MKNALFRAMAILFETIDLPKTAAAYEYPSAEIAESFADSRLNGDPGDYSLRVGKRGAVNKPVCLRERKRTCGSKVSA